MRVDTLARSAPASLARADQRLVDTGERVLARAGTVIERSTSRLEVLAARVAALDPAVQLARGWSITRDADGRVVRSIEDLARDDIVTIAVADGLITSTVTDTNRTAP